MRIDDIDTDEAQAAVGRLTAWVRDYGDSKEPAFIADLSLVIELAKFMTEPVAANIATVQDVIDMHTANQLATDFPSGMAASIARQIEGN